jgi:hypothetical protein
MTEPRVNCPKESAPGLVPGKASPNMPEDPRESPTEPIANTAESAISARYGMVSSVTPIRVMVLPKNPPNDRDIQT